MLALAVFAVGTLGMLEAVHRAQAASTDGENMVTAAHLAHRRLEELANLTYAAVASEAKAAITTPSGFSRFSRQVTVTTPIANLKQIAVTVYWNAPGGETSAALQTYRSAD